jgi:hypothetical protein
MTKRTAIFLRVLPSWLISAIFHMLLIVLLAIITVVQPVTQVAFLAGEFSEPIENQTEVDQLAVILVEPAGLPTLQEATESNVDPTTPSSPSVLTNLNDPNFQHSVAHVMLAPTAPEMSQPKPLIQWASFEGATVNLAGAARAAHEASLKKSFDGRGADQKRALLLKYGGSEQSEAAVQRALQWIAAHQAVDGGWTFGHDEVCNGQCDSPGRMTSSRNAATGLALLTFLGAGQTHLDGKYKDNINRGIEYLLRHQEVEVGTIPIGSWREEGGTMYAHCLATIAICEAYAITNDSRLHDPSQFALNYLAATQDPVGGGWRYAPQQPGDTSVVGWAVMALKSGRIGGLVVPQLTINLADRFLESVGSYGGANYGYTNPVLKLDNGMATSAIGMLCRMYQGVPKGHSGMARGIQMISSAGPRLGNLYYTYYAAQVMRHHGGAEWDEWNLKMRDPLIAWQIKEGHASGSWLPNPFPEMGGRTGGRLYSTCMATMILEVYYRHMPLYSDKAVEDDFKL